VVRGSQGIFRVVASDLDGTLLRSDGSISARTKAALRRTRDAGIEVALVTARPPWWMRDLAAELGAGDVAICCNGAVVYDLVEGRTLHRFALEPATATRLVQALRERAPGVAFACERDTIAIREPAYDPLWKTPDQHPRTDALVFCAEPLSKLVVQHPALSQSELHVLAVELCGDDAIATYSGERLVEISAAGVTKAYALARLCDEQGIEPEAVLAFGDMPNDVPLLRFAGRGVAVANAHPDALAAADEITASNDEDGVALVLEALLRD
jgi:Cof subfamily protein (haloacid dehalogenase superfamily)